MLGKVFSNKTAEKTARMYFLTGLLVVLLILIGFAFGYNATENFTDNETVDTFAMVSSASTEGVNSFDEAFDDSTNASSPYSSGEFTINENSSTNDGEEPTLLPETEENPNTAPSEEPNASSPIDENLTDESDATLIVQSEIVMVDTNPTAESINTTVEIPATPSEKGYSYLRKVFPMPNVDGKTSIDLESELDQFIGYSDAYVISLYNETYFETNLKLVSAITYYISFRDQKVTRIVYQFQDRQDTLIIMMDADGNIIGHRIYDRRII